MIEALILILAVIVFWFLMRTATGPLNLAQGHPYAPFAYLTVIMTVLGLILITGLDIRINYLELVTPGAVRAAVWSVAYALVSFPLGVWVAEVILRRTRKRVPTQTVPTSAAATVSSVCLVFISVLVVAYVYVNLPVVPFLSILDSPLEVAQTRILAARGFQGNTYIRNIFALTFVPLASCVLYAQYLHYRGTVLRTLFVISAISSLLALSYDLSKGPVVFYMLSLLFVRNRFGAFSAEALRRLRNVTLIGGAGLSAMYVFVMGVAWEDLFDLWNVNSLAFRVLLGQVQPLLLHFEAFPDIIPFQYGRSITGLLWFESGEISARLVMEWVNPWGVANGVAGVANTFYIAEAWANFGLVGVILTPIMFGVTWHFLISYVSARKSPVRLGILGFLVVQLAVISQGSMIRLFYNPELLGSALLLWLCLTAGRVMTGGTPKISEGGQSASSVPNR